MIKKDLVNTPHTFFFFLLFIQQELRFRGRPINAHQNLTKEFWPFFAIVSLFAKTIDKVLSLFNKHFNYFVNCPWLFANPLITHCHEWLKQHWDTDMPKWRHLYSYNHFIFLFFFITAMSFLACFWNLPHHKQQEILHKLSIFQKLL